MLGGIEDRAHFPPWVAQIELLHLAGRTPAKIAVTSIAAIGMGNRLESPGGIKAPRKLVGKRLDGNAAFLLRCAYRALIEALGVQLPPFYACDLRSDQRLSIFKVLRAVFSPDDELPVMGSHAVESRYPENSVMEPIPYLSSVRFSTHGWLSTAMATPIPQQAREIHVLRRVLLPEKPLQCGARAL